MYGKGIAKGMWVTLRRLCGSFADDARYAGKRYLTGGQELSGDLLLKRQGPQARGAFTVQYPDEKYPVPENFRYMPFLLYDDETGEPLCTACGTCVRVCPPQCIWIVRGKDPETGRPKKSPDEFFIDASICMSCGSCAEFCPFDAIKMNHDYEIAAYDRSELLFDMEKLSHPVSYHTKLHPTAWAAEEKARAAKAAAKAAKKKKATTP